MKSLVVLFLTVLSVVAFSATNIHRPHRRISTPRRTEIVVPWETVAAVCASAGTIIAGYKESFFVNVDEVAGKSTVSVKKLDCWRNLVWEFRKRDADEAKTVFADYFNPAKESGPFAEMIEAISEKNREAIAIWMNETAFNALRDDFIKEMDRELEERLHLEHDHLNLMNQDNAMIESTIEKCHDLNNKMKLL